MRPRRLQFLLLGASLLACPHGFAGQDGEPKGGTKRAATARPVAPPVDPRFRSPRATVRTFPIAMNSAEDDPHRIEDAVACLDLS
jgi:hypothetical protein